MRGKTQYEPAKISMQFDVSSQCHVLIGVAIYQSVAERQFNE